MQDHKTFNLNYPHISIELSSSFFWNNKFCWKAFALPIFGMRGIQALHY